MTRSRSFNINRLAGRKGPPKPFRGYQADSELYPLYTVAVAFNATDSERQAAQMLKDYLRKSCGVALPVTTAHDGSTQELDNCFLIGRTLAQHAGMVRELELGHVGPEGFVLHGEAGRVAIAGHDDAGTFFGVSRYLEQLGFRFLVPGQREIVPDLKDHFVNPIYLLDWPSFQQRPVPGAGWQLRASLAPATPPAARTRLASRSDPLVHLQRTAALIKSFARQGKTKPPPIRLPAEQADRFTYVIAKLLWNPFLDMSRLVREFSQ